MKFLKDKKLVALILVFVVLLGIYIAISGSRSRKQKDEDINSQQAITLTAYQEQDVKSFSYKYDELGIDLHFDRDGVNSWICREYPDYQIDPTKIHMILDDILNIKAQRYLEADEYDASDPAYGLAAPEAVVTIDDGITMTELTVGGMTGVWYYCKSNLSDRLYAIANDLMLAIDQTILDVVRFTKLPGINKTTVRGITLEYNGSTYVFTPNVTTVTVTGDDGSTSEEEQTIWTSQKNGILTQTSSSDIEMGIEALCNLEQVRCVSYNSSEQDYQAYGISEPYAVFQIDYVDNNGEPASYTLNCGRLDDAGKSRFVQIGGVDQITTVGSVFDSHILPSLIANAGEVVDTQETIDPHTPFADFDT